MEGIFSRTERLIGKEGISHLASKHVAVFGIGGVGSFVAESLARSGIGKVTIVDFDDVSVSNINRQLIANTKTIGRLKVDVMRERISTINPYMEVVTLNYKYTPENCSEFFVDDYDYIVDAIDMVTSKLSLIVESQKRNIPIISSMGTGNKLDPTKLVVTDIYKTSACPLAKVMRKELKNRNVKKLKVVYSTELPIKPILDEEEKKENSRKIAPGSIAFVPSTAGLIISSVLVNEFLDELK